MKWRAALAAAMLIPSLSWGDVVEVKSVSASHDDGNVPLNMLDGTIDTRWSAEGEAWALFDLGSVRQLTEVYIAWYNGEQRVYSFDLEVSVDGQVWQLVYIGSSTGVSNSPEVFKLAGPMARYVRYLGHANNQNNWNSVTEVSFEGSPAFTKAVSLAWDDPDNDPGTIIGYRVYYGPTSEEMTESHEVGKSLQTTVIAPILGTRLYFAVTARNASAESQLSNVVSVDTPVYKLMPPDIERIYAQ